MNAMEACILENEERQVRVAEIGGARYVEDVRGRFVPEALYQAQVREIGTGVTLVNGRDFMTDASARLVPLDMVKPQHKLEDGWCARSSPLPSTFPPRLAVSSNTR
nr:hypothetical protein [Marinicella sp. W31]MDC2878288.1 hypothetical protein [Marinicella sp. W31]